MSDGEYEQVTVNLAGPASQAMRDTVQATENTRIANTVEEALVRGADVLIREPDGRIFRLVFNRG